MNRVHQQLRTWWLMEATVRFVWGLAQWLAVGITVLALACLVDWIYDRYDETPFWLRVLMLAFQVALAAGLAFVFILRPLRRVPTYDDLATRAERAIPEFDHRLVTALQLNRPEARTGGMSKVLIAEVTKEAGSIASHHQLASLANFQPLMWAASVLGPVVLTTGIVFAFNPSLNVILLKRQLLMSAEIPRSVALTNETDAVWPNGAEVVIRIRVTGEWNEEMVGEVRVQPEEQVEDRFPLKFEKSDSDGSAIFSAKLPPSSTPFTFRARLADGRLKSPGHVEFEAPPQVKHLEASQLLPSYLGRRPDGDTFERYNDGGIKGDVVDALPLSGVLVVANFTKPVKSAVLFPIERGGGNNDVDGAPIQPRFVADDRLGAAWRFPTSPQIVGYRIALTDDRGFHNPSPIKREIKMWPDQPPEVEKMRESTRNPDPTDYYGGGDPLLYECDMPLSPSGRIMVIFNARSQLGIGQVNLAYRVIPKSQEAADTLHPRDDPNWRVFTRDVLYTWDMKSTPPRKLDPALGSFVADLGLFEKSFAGKTSWLDQEKVRVPCHLAPAADPENDPGEIAAGGRSYLDTGNPMDPNRSGLIRPDGSKISLQVGDRVEVYIEVIDKYEFIRKADAAKRGVRFTPRPSGYPREAILKTVVEPSEAWLRTHQRKVTQSRLKDKLTTLSAEQEDIFNPPEPKKKP